MVCRRLMATLALVLALSAYAARPAYALLGLGSANPNQGTTNGGTVVDITAADSMSGTIESVEFGGVPATNVTLVNLFLIRCTAPAHAAGHVSIVVHVHHVVNGVPIDEPVTVTGGYDYIAPPALTSVAPPNGPATGGTTVTVTGTNFRTGGPNAQTPGGMTVHFGPNAGTNVILNSATQLTVTTPPGPVGAVDVSVTNGEGETATLTNAFTYTGTQSTPTITNIAPSQGPQTGGTDIVITGTGFQPGVLVTICGQSAPVLNATSTSISTITPACPPGPVTITVTNPDGGTATSTSGFTSFQTSSPTITSITPNVGPANVATPVTIVGTGFQGNAVVTIGCGTATGITTINDTRITALTPACPAGYANVTVTNGDGGTVTLGGGYRFGMPAPSVGGSAPNTGSASGGTPVTITGSNFGSGAVVLFGSSPGTGTRIIDPNTLTTVTPPSATTGAVAITVTNPDGQSGTLPGAFTYTTGGSGGGGGGGGGGGTPGDADGDGLPDDCEIKFGLNPNSGVGNDGPLGDPDGDGQTNAQECANGTHPRGFFKRYMAEGATGPFFDMEFELLNPTNQPAIVLLEYQPQVADPANPHPSDYIIVPPMSRRTVNPELNPAMAHSSFSTIVESDTQVIVERTMKWDSRHYGSHSETSQPSPETVWYLAEGATHGSFNLFYLIQNPNDSDTTVEVTYLRPAPKPPIVKSYAVAAKTRLTIWVDAEGPEFEAEEFSAVFNSTLPIMVERSMYADTPDQVWAGGTSAAAVHQPEGQWFFAEGATGSFFDTFFLIENPNPAALTVRATYLLYTGVSFTKDYVVAGNTRFTLGANADDPQLANTAFSTKFETLGGEGIIVERSMWWPASLPWIEGHDSAGVTATGTMWAVAEGDIGGPDNAETYVLVANTSPFTAHLRVRALADDNTVVERLFDVTHDTRFNINVRDMFPEMIGKKFGVVIESQGATPAQITAEVSVYLSADGVSWSAGSNAQATRLQ